MTGNLQLIFRDVEFLIKLGMFLLRLCTVVINLSHYSAIIIEK